MATEQMEMKEFESKIFGFDLMKRSKLQRQICQGEASHHFPDYVLLLSSNIRGCMLELVLSLCFGILVLNVLAMLLLQCSLPTNQLTRKVFNEKPYTPTEKFICGAVQILSWLILLSGYLLVAIGIVKGSRDVVRKFKSSDCNFSAILIFFCPVLCLVLLALIIGPIATTRYRLIMLPFFSVLAAYAYSGPQEKVKATHLEDN